MKDIEQENRICPCIKLGWPGPGLLYSEKDAKGQRP